MAGLDLTELLERGAAQPRTHGDVDAVWRRGRNRRWRKRGGVVGGACAAVLAASLALATIPPPPSPYIGDAPSTQDEGFGEQEMKVFCQLFHEADRGPSTPEVGSQEHVEQLMRLVAAAPPQIVDDMRIVRDHVRDHVSPDDPTSQTIEGYPEQVQAAAGAVDQFVQAACPDTQGAGTGAPEATAFLDRLTDFARDPGAETLDAVAFADTVQLALGSGVVREVAAAELDDPGTWRLDVGQFAGHAGPFSILDHLAHPGEWTTTPGPEPDCVGRRHPTPAELSSFERLMLLPDWDGRDSCEGWFAVDVYLEADRVVAIGLDLLPPSS